MSLKKKPVNTEEVTKVIPLVGAQVPTETEDPDQEIIEVSQAEVKTALKNLLIKKNDILSLLYTKHDEYNKEYFDGKLSIPLITIEKMSNKTLGSYRYEADTSGIENHIYMNRNFIALNTETRILETLRHEMIHQYQDEVLYEKYGDDGNLIHEGDKRPAEWHNKAFKELAAILGIPAEGIHCTGNPAHMPEAKSYNRKFACGCIATNGYPLTIWSTREVNATCNVCGKPFKELKKSGGTIEVKSAIMAEGEDHVQTEMLQKYGSFARYKNKGDLTKHVKDLKAAKVPYKEGIYHKGNSMYYANYLYWVAYGDPEVGIEALREQEEEQAIEDLKDIKDSMEAAAAQVEASEELKAAHTVEGDEPTPEKPKRGRKPGSKNKPKGEGKNDKGNTVKEA